MSLASLEKEILAELRAVSGNAKLTKNSIMEWSTGPIAAAEGEALYYLPGLHVNVAVKLPAPKAKKAAAL